CFPLMLMGLAGMSNQVVDKFVFPAVYPDHANWSSELGIYTACFKIAMIMIMFTQAFRYAYEPFVFEKSKEKGAQQAYANVMKYFIIFGLIIFLGIMLYIDVVKMIINPSYHEGLKIVSLVLMANLFFGIFFNLSIWYKIKDLTRFGAIIALIGAGITILLNVLLVPRMGYMGSAVAVLVCFIIMVIINYLWGQKHYYVPYDLKRIAAYFAAALALYAVSFFTAVFPNFLRHTFNTLLLLAFFLFVFLLEGKEIRTIIKK
ncbi:MAG: polysaccharide biosynthesis C-terminal domain-containing protein, partial [Prolixibacteraceae bacterium]|nr:polysaccharide biosynthesis C-terminal domain-containing protein [Prolixibacteraceae bacterium]